jgi:hypothetical protein
MIDPVVIHNNFYHNMPSQQLHQSYNLADRIQNNARLLQTNHVDYRWNNSLHKYDLKGPELFHRQEDLFPRKY